MEIVLAVLLLFGVITLGSVTADKGNDDTQSTMALPNADGVPDSHQITQAVRQRNPPRCHCDGSVIYRDLTVPYQDQVGQQASQAGGYEGGRDCSYNPTAFPPSMEVNCPDE